MIANAFLLLEHSKRKILFPNFYTESNAINSNHFHVEASEYCFNLHFLFLFDDKTSLLWLFTTESCN